MHNPAFACAAAALRQALLVVVSFAFATAAGAGVLTPTPRPTVTGTPPPLPTGRYDIIGHVGTGADCEDDAAGVTVHISYPESTQVTSSTGDFLFPDRPYGGYTLTFEPNCPLIPCYPTQYAFLDGFSDAHVEVCYDGCPAALLLSSSSGPAGTVVDLAGRCDAARSRHRVEIRFDDQPVAEVFGDDAGVYRSTFMVPLDADPSGTHAIRTIIDDAQAASASFAVTVGGAPCVGDCDHSGAVTVDEIVRGAHIALTQGSTSTCDAMDTTRDGTITIEELIAAVDRALNGCRAADLVPVSARYSRCVTFPCSAEEQVTHFMEVCVANRGNADAGGFYVLQTNGGPGSAGRIDGLAAGEEACVEIRFAPAVDILVDTGNEVMERDETNNHLSLALPVPTACDVLPPPCTPTATPTQTQIPTPT